MKKSIFIIIFLFLIFNSKVFGQEYFEGELKYKIEYEPLHPNISKNMLETEFGNSFSAYVKEDRYTMIYHATGQIGWMKIIVRLDEGYTYTEFEKNDTIIKSKFGKKKNKLLIFKKNKDDKKEVLGELCESITLDYELEPDAFFPTQKGKYYFNPKYKLNSSLYENYTDGFWNLYVKESKSISIRNEIEYPSIFKSVSEATSITPKKISFEMFEPNKSKVISIKE